MLTKTILPNGDVIFQDIEDNIQPNYRIWLGSLTQADQDDIICTPNNMNDSDFLQFGNEVYNNPLVSSIARDKNGSYKIILPYSKKDIFLSRNYIKYNDGREIFFILNDMADGTTTFEIQSKNADGNFLDSIITFENFEIKVRQYYE